MSIQLTDHQAELLARVIVLIARGDLRLQDLEGVTIDQELVGQGWSYVVTRLEKGFVDKKLVDLIQALADMDPSFPSSSFCLGLAYKKLKEREKARACFSAQLEHPSGEHKDLCEAYLAELAAA